MLIALGGRLAERLKLHWHKHCSTKGTAAKDRTIPVGGNQEMKELAGSFAQLIAIIMITLVLAISSAAVSQWASADTTTETGAQTQASFVSSAMP
jgi:hypothetical protein